MGTRRNLESPHVAPAKVHPVVAEVGATAEIFAGDKPVPSPFVFAGARSKASSRNSARKGDTTALHPVIKFVAGVTIHR
jgi:hypothetical protein